jgi:hypothetical protein
MIAHAGVAFDRSTAGTCTLRGAKTFLKAMLTTIHVTADSTAESLFSIEIDEIAALGTLPLLLNDGFMESRICFCHIHYGLPISGLLSDFSNHFSREIRELQLLFLRSGGHDRRCCNELQLLVGRAAFSCSNCKWPGSINRTRTRTILCPRIEQKV